MTEQSEIVDVRQSLADALADRSEKQDLLDAGILKNKVRRKLVTDFSVIDPGSFDL